MLLIRAMLKSPSDCGTDPFREDRSLGIPGPAAVRRCAVMLLLVANILGGPARGAEPPAERVAEVRIEGNRTIPAAKIIARVKTRAGRPFDPETVQGDVRTLYQLGWFVDVQPFYETVARGRAVIFRVTERSTLRWVKYLGNRKVRDKTLAKETGIKVGDSVDPYAVEEGRRKIEDLYHKRGYNQVQVSILDGNKSDDLGATYVINEGQVQRIAKVRFIGNTIATAARLKTQIQSKPGFLWLFHGYVDRAKVDEDVDRLTAYYRSLGFFRAEVGRELDYNERGNWLTISFVIHEGPRYKIRNVSFLGTRRFDADALAGVVHLKSGEYFNQSEMQRDLSTLRDLYGSQGYVFADVQADPRFLPEPGQLDLLYHIEEGKRYRVGEIRIHVKGEFPHTRVQTVLNRLSLRTGDIVDIRKIRSDERRLRASGLFLTDPSRGSGPKIVLTPPEIADSEIAKRPSRGRSKFRGQSPDEGVIGLQLEGRWNRLRADNSGRSERDHGAGNRRDRPVVRGQSPAGSVDRPRQAPPQVTQAVPQYGGRPMGSLGPGAGGFAAPRTVYQNVPAPPRPTSGPALPSYSAPAPPPYSAPPPLPPAPPAATAANPATDGGFSLFPGAQTTPPPISLYEPSLPLDVNVEETQTGRFMVGVGVNSSAGVVGSVTIDEQNFDLFRVPTSLEDFRNGTAFRGRGQKFRLELLPGSVVQRYLVNFEEPYLFDTPISLGLSGFFFDRRFDDWDEQRIGGRASLGYQLTPDLSTVFSYRGENVNIRNPRVPSPPELAEVVGNNQLHGFKLGVTNDTRDSPFLATQGHYIELTTEQVVGTFDYPRATADLRKYFLVHERPDGSGRNVLSFSTRLGYSGSNTPIYDNFFAGGFSTLRGFQFRDASPVNMGVTVGGRFMFIGSAEYLMPVTADDMLSAVFFVDYGTVEKNIEINDFRVVPGIGLRVTVPALGPAPIALDFAFPIISAPTDQEQVFSFNIGFLR